MSEVLWKPEGAKACGILGKKGYRRTRKYEQMRGSSAKGEYREDLERGEEVGLGGQDHKEGDGKQGKVDGF